MTGLKAFRAGLLAACVTVALPTWGAAEFFVVLGSYQSEASARQEGRRAAGKHAIETAIRQAAGAGGDTLFRVLAGPYPSYAGASDAREAIGREDTWIVRYESAQVAAPAPVVAEAPLPQAAPRVEPGPQRAESVARRSASRDVLGNEALVRRGVPADLNRGVTPRVTEESLERYFATRPQEPNGVLPPLAPAAPDALSAQPTVVLQDVEFRGGAGHITTALGAQIEPMVAELRGRAVATEDVLNLKNRINQLLVTEGFVNSGVIIPDQRVTAGVVRLDVVEGKVDRISVNSRLRSSYVRTRLATGEPFNLKSLQTSLKLLEKDPLVQRIHARVVPGSELGLADLELDVETTPFHRIGFGASNDRSPSIGAEHGQVWIASDNLTNRGDKIYLGSSFTEGLDGHSASYTLPVNRFGHELSIGYSASDSTVIEEPFTAVDIESETTGSRLGYRVPIRRSLEGELALDLTLERRRNFTTLLGLPYSFSEGAVNGESRVAPVRLGLSWVRQGLDRSMAARLVLSRGTTQYDATTHADRADARFTAALAQFQYSRLLWGKVQGTARLLAQVSDDALLAIERVALGGHGTVRGYRQNQLVRDNAFLMSLEGRYRLPGDQFRTDFVAFYDWGVGKNDDAAATSDQDDIASVGIGLSTRRGGLKGELFWALALNEVRVQEEDLQDKGVHVKVTYEYRF